MPGLVVFVGILVGVLLAYIAPEELKASNAYFILAERFLFIGIVTLLVHAAVSSTLISVLVCGALSAIALYVRMHDISRILYGLCAVALFIALPNQALLFSVAVLTFIFGMVRASSALVAHVRDDEMQIPLRSAVRKQLKSHSYFLIVFVGLFALGHLLRFA